MKSTRIYSFIGLLIMVLAFISVDTSQNTITRAETLQVTIALSSIQNSCIVNNANTAIVNANPTPIVASNNWWGMPIGATDFSTNTFAGDSVSSNVVHAPHLTLIPDGCALSGTDWIAFTEQDVQHAIQSELAKLGGIDFALVDFQVGVGARFTFVTKPAYGSIQAEATIRLETSTDGNFATWLFDTNLPTNDTVRQIATCELMPLFINSLQVVRTRLTLPSQAISQMVVMNDALRLRFSQPTEITPEPAPELALMYDATCLPAPTAIQEVTWGKSRAPQHEPQSQPAPTPMMIGDAQVTIPPLEGEFTLLETGLEQSSQNICGVEGEPIWCSLLSDGDVFTYPNATPNSPTAFISINRVGDEIFYIDHVNATQTDVEFGIIPSWGAVTPNHARLAFACQGNQRLCYWDSQSDVTTFVQGAYAGINQSEISPDGTKIVYNLIAFGYDPSGYRIYTIDTATSQLFNIHLRTYDPRWSDSSTPYYMSSPASHTTTVGAMRAHVDDVIELGGTGNLFVSYLTGAYRYDVHDGKVLYWRLGTSSGYQLWLYDANANPKSAPILSLPKIATVHWSPDGTRFMLLYPTISTSQCIRVYDITNVSTYTEIACSSDYQYGVAWGGGVDLSAFADEPDVCSGSIGIGSWGFRKNPSDDAFFEPTGTDPYIRNAPQVNILGTNGTWYYIEYNNYEGWVVGEAVETIEAGCEPPLGTDDDSTGDFIRTEVIYDYQLELPQGFWALRDEQIAIPDWDSASIEAKNYAKEWAYTYCQEGKHPQYWQPCSMIVFVIYYQLFEQIYGRPPMMSDILATGYEVEVSPFTQRGEYDLAEEALAGHYFQTIREYCHHVLNIGEDITDVRIGENDCYNNTIPIIPSEALVMGWRRKDYTDNYNNQGYFWTLQAWYDQAICLREWYFGNQGEAIPDRTQITQLSELNGICDRNRPSILLASAAENKNIGLQQLTADKARNARFLDWANYAYDNATHNGYLADFNNPYNRAIRLWMVPEADETNDEINPEYPIQMELCQINLTHGVVIREDVRVPIWGEDVLVVIAKNGISAGLGNASTYNMSTHPRPAWLELPSETAKFTSSPYRTCPCTVNNQRLPGTNFPFETRCERN